MPRSMRLPKFFNCNVIFQFQVTYSSYICSGPKPTCFSTFDPISTNDIRDGPFCCKQPKETFLLFKPKHLHRFQPFLVRQHDFNSPTSFENPQTPISNSLDMEKRIAEDVCDIKSQGPSQINNVPEVITEATPPPGPEETVYDDEASKQCISSVDTQDRGSEDLPNESMPEDEIAASPGPISVETEGQEEQSSLNPSDSDHNPFAQCSATPGSLSDETSSFNPASTNSETVTEIPNLQTEAIQAESGAYEPKLEECSERIEGTTPGSSCTTQVNPVTIEGETQLPQGSGDEVCTQQEISQSFPAQSTSFDTAYENVSSASALVSDESSPPSLNTECANPTTTPVIKDSFSGPIPTTTALDHITYTQESPETKVITENPVTTTLTNQCTNVLSNMLTGLSSLSAKTSLTKPIYEEVIRHIPTVRNVVRHHFVETTHHVPIIEKIVQHERHDIIKHIPVVQKFTRNVEECCTKHIPIVQHRARTIEEPYIEHVPRTAKITRPVVETLVKHVPIVFSRYRPVIHERVRHIPTVQTKLVPIVEQTITTVPVKQKVIKHIVEDRIRPIGPYGGRTPERTLTPPTIISSGLNRLCAY